MEVLKKAGGWEGKEEKRGPEKGRRMGKKVLKKAIISVSS
jgi:uncharacterized GH25 family protein